ncbi:unnamed protein product [Nippostrongylus brasiliensis]|uniref:Uncharacterized protein n=1 Tax=Nippostrongylus brasiliensis TaxID=27835 RepID=A0A0N4XKB3_NIPBR|nr:unnamed protein product [Nippostrongylus brasiliensis]
MENYVRHPAHGNKTLPLSIPMKRMKYSCDLEELAEEYADEVCHGSPEQLRLSIGLNWFVAPQEKIYGRHHAIKRTCYTDVSSVIHFETRALQFVEAMKEKLSPQSWKFS